MVEEKMKKVGIVGVGKFLPEKVLTNADLEKMVDTSDEWITTRTGIKTRRMAAEGEAASDLAIRAAKAALKDAKILAKDLDLIIVASITPDMQFPSTACFVQTGLGAKQAVCFDLSAACSGFIYALVTAKQYIACGTYKNVLVVGSEVLSKVTNWEDRNTCVLFGDGAGAVVLAPVESGGILSTYLGSDGSVGDMLMLPGGGSRNPASHQSVDDHLHCIRMRGNELFKIAVKSMADAAQRVISLAGLSPDDVDWIIPHQANTRILMSVAKKLKLPEEKFYINIEKYGNISSASIPVALCEALESNSIKKGDIILLDAFGGGLVWGACLIKW